jgi:hypothetical protein
MTTTTTMSTPSAKPEPKIETRDSFFNRDKDYVYQNVCLLRKLTIKRPKGCKQFSLYINGVEIRPTEENTTEIIWNFQEVRYRIEECYDDNNMIRLNDMFVYNSLQALSHYSTVPPEEFDQTIFTQDLIIQVRPPNKTALCATFEAFEEVFESDVRLGIHKEE